MSSGPQVRCTSSRLLRQTDKKQPLTDAPELHTRILAYLGLPLVSSAYIPFRLFSPVVVLSRLKTEVKTSHD